ncbi:MAG TPA: hypothetical protein RMH99_23360 [Sandaracinaceae bacterium LLY-WYZ-13_1]|nr:hypothetical protein [Sandaracinaceae bacterium LLY-WYZ-13_1]
MNRHTTFFFVAITTLALAAASCGPVSRGGRRSRGGGGGSSGGEAAFTSQCRGDFGASAAANRFETFMGSVWEFHQAATRTQQTLLDACQQMGRALELPAAQLDGAGPDGTRAVCGAVTEALRTEMAAIREGSETTVELRTRPPHCEARFDAYADCAARCDVDLEPGELELRCEGGEVRGQCSAECSGRCAVDVDARCEGVCEGRCEGTCTQRGPDGSCAGACDGTCHGECVADVSGECGGECRGSCSVEWQEPYCTGHYDPPQVSADCQAACEARVEASMECRPGEAELVVSGGPGPDVQARLERVREAVRVGLATVLTVRERVQRLRESGRAVLAQLEQLPDSVRSVGVSAAACSAGALADLRSSLAAVSVSVEVSVSVSASVSAGTG